MRRRSRGLSADDKVVWSTVTKGVTPLPKTGPKAPALSSLPLNTPKRTGPDRVVAAPVGHDPRPPAKPRTTINLAPDRMTAPASPSMDAKAYARLKRGKLKPEARIDLHGMTAERAHTALRGFIIDAHARGLRLVLVITGKGRPAHDHESPSRRGVLRNAVPVWLSQAPASSLVLQLAPAHQRHGGGGAYYVYLRRKR